MSIITFQQVSKTYKQSSNPVIHDLNLSIEAGEFITLIGPSGCGKTTLLKMINTLIQPTSGTISVQGKSIDKWDTIQLRRMIGYVIQQVGLFPHMNIKKNITYVLDINGEKDKDFKDKRATELIQFVGLSPDLLSRHPSQLSGGQKQRIGVARALAADPDIILMDEPFGAVDEIARTRLQEELLSIHRKLKKTIIFVTHDIGEAFKLGTTIILMNNGKIEQMGTKDELIFKPKTDFVKQFIGLKGFKETLDEEALQVAYEEMKSKK
ncbi:ABC transporter ATP-binding protein [Longirhabdus pacifica]|uniref:ABC transporter ATP-binding protein n=1 Tax=Longirhabdus pacifica TaxID=2305227 RepID=UPI0010088C10|nr:ATP-binding cassette domain-containing protein [Longirhabdus pacifica]